MTPNQVNACRNRNEQLKLHIQGESVTYDMVRRATTDIDNLLIDLDAAIERARMEQNSRQEWQDDLAAEKRTNADLWHTVEPLRDKLKKARRLLNKYSLENPTQQDKNDVRDVLKQ